MFQGSQGVSYLADSTMTSVGGNIENLNSAIDNINITEENSIDTTINGNSRSSSSSSNNNNSNDSNIGNNNIHNYTIYNNQFPMPYNYSAMDMTITRWNADYSAFGFDESSLLPPSVLANQPWILEPSPNWSTYTPPDTCSPFYDTSFDRCSDLSLVSTSPTTVASQSDTLFDHLDLARSPAPSFTSSLSQESSTCRDLCGQANMAIKTSADQQPPKRTRKPVARKVLKGRKPPIKTELRSQQDIILVQCRNQGMSYKKIKETHGFDVSESTLRGRHRALTKHISERPRKPEWKEIDIHLLQKAVPLFTRHTGKTKVSWKGVSEYILDHGGSHYFAFTTCRRKWCEVTGLTI
ncbi:hypothetical protein E4U21_004522 [Claviceps maximensis]|nr:hypothetical protein E4U21_004522 [Claviceps maximensis]